MHPSGPVPVVRTAPLWVALGLVALLAALPGTMPGAEAATPVPGAAFEAVAQYVKAMAAGDRAAVSRLDFTCQFNTVSPQPAGSNAGKEACWTPIARANAEPLMREDQGVNALWPGKDRLVFFSEDFGRYDYAPSAFVSQRVGDPTSGTTLTVDHLDTKRIPPTSFRVHPDGDMVGAPASLVSVRIRYQNPIASPVSYAPGAYQWANPVTRPRAALKAVTLKWVVLSDLKRLGFPADLAVLNLPVVAATPMQPAVPFLVEHSGYVRGSADWWGPSDAPERLTAAVERARGLSALMDRVALLNRVLMIDPDHPGALTALTGSLYDAILKSGEAAQQIQLSHAGLSARVSEFYWNSYAQTERVDISLGMEMGGYAEPTAADYLFRMIPAMDRLATLRPDDLENQIRLGTAYRWNLDQNAAIDTHAAVVLAAPAARPELRARALTELAWSRITKVAYNRTFDDPGIREAYEEAGRAYELGDDPVEKFAAAYTMAYSLVFMPERDNRAMLRHLREAKRWFLTVPGASEASWLAMLSNDTLRPVIDADPELTTLVATGDK